MKPDRNYLELTQSLKSEIINSRYQCAGAVNREQLLLYYKTGKMLSEKSKAQKWGTKVLEPIAVDLQNNLPGLKGFSFTNLKKMRQVSGLPEFGNNTVSDGTNWRDWFINPRKRN